MPPFVDLRKAARSLGRHRFPSHRVRTTTGAEYVPGQGVRRHVDMLLGDILLRSPLHKTTINRHVDK
jgi:hypothetical protein